MNTDTASYLLHCFRATHGAGTRHWPIPAESMDWANFLAAAKRHGLLNHLHDLARNNETHANPPDHVIAAAVEQNTYADALDRKALYTLRMVDQALKDEGMPYAVLKGPALTRRAYADDPHRSYGDLDILVRRRDRERALRAIEPRYFAQRAGPVSKWFVRHIHFHTLLWPCFDGCLPLEVHWSLVDRANLYRIRDDDVLDHVHPIHEGDASVPALNPADEFIYLCIHAAKHGTLNRMALEQHAPAEWFCEVDSGNRLRWFMDIQRYLETQQTALDWDVIRTRVDDWNTRDDVLASLRVLERLLPDSAAACALRRLGAPATWTEDTAPPRFQGGRLNQWLLARGMSMHKGVAVRPVRLWTAIRVLFPSPTELRRYYGTRAAWPLPLLFLIHPFHMIRKQFT